MNHAGGVYDGQIHHLHNADADFDSYINRDRAAGIRNVLTIVALIVAAELH